MRYAGEERGCGRAEHAWEPTSARVCMLAPPPQVQTTLHIGGVEFQLFHDRGETDDATWVYLPKHRGACRRARARARARQRRGILMYVVWRVSVVAICTGDLFIWATPNCGNPQKVRYVSKVCSKRKSQTEAMRGLWCAPQVQRYPREWSAALKKMLKLDAEYLLPGHGMR